MVFENAILQNVVIKTTFQELFSEKSHLKKLCSAK